MGCVSGKFVLRVPAKTHVRLKNQAQQKGLSLNTLCVDLLHDALNNKQDILPFKRLSAITKKILKWMPNKIMATLVFGSVIDQNQFATSDIDLLVVLDKLVTLNRKLYTAWDACLEDHKLPVINPHFVHLPTFDSHCGSLWLEVAQKNEIIWQKNKKIEKALAQINKLIASSKAKQSNLHGHAYWVWT